MPAAVKLKRVPTKIRHAIALLLSGEVTTIKSAAARVNMSREWLSRSLSFPHIQAFLANETRKTLANGTLRASARLLELMDHDSGKVSLEASKHTLALAGLKPPDSPQIVNNLNAIPGYEVVLPGRRFSTIEGQFVKVAEPDLEDTKDG